MGIRKLNTIIKQYSSGSITTKRIEFYSGKTFAIDCSILLYKYVYVTTIENSHLIGFMNRANYYMRYNILPVFVFDGIPPKEKEDTINKRQLNKKKIVEKIQELKEKRLTTKISDEIKVIDLDISKLNNQLIYINKYHILECKELLTAMGVPYFDAPGEAEKFCVYLQKINKVDYVVTDDTDAFTFGGTNIIKTSIKNNNIIEVNLNQLLKDLKMSYEEFVDFCILCGCDYAEPISYIGPITAYNLINKHRTLEEVNEKSKYEITFDYEKIRNIFTNYDNMPEIQNLTLNKPDPIILTQFLSKYNLTKQSNFSKLFTNMNIS